VVPSEIRLQRQIIQSSPGAARILYNAAPLDGVLHDIRTAEMAHRFGVSWVTGLKPIWGNFLLLVPLGYFLPWLSPRWRRLRSIALAVFVVAAGLELIQLAGTLAYGFPYRRVDIDTVWINFIGGMIGYGLFKVMVPHLKRLGLVAAHSSGSPASAG
jgi:glycopeptide antibiotics resistance protein